jgi:AcrR family transcriptional regulator
MRIGRGPFDDGDSVALGGPFRDAAGAELTPHQLMEKRRRSRILTGALNVFGQKGFAATTVQDLVDEVGIARATFYKYYPDREACLVALNDAVLIWLEEEARAAGGSVTAWPVRVQAVTERLVALVSGDARVARVCGYEASLVSRAVWERRRQSLDALADALRLGRQHARRGDELPPILEDLLVGGAVELATRSVVLDRRPQSGELGSEIAEFILFPYVGAARARKLVRGD